MRTITDHVFDGAKNVLNSSLRVVALDEPGPGGANHEYRIEVDGILSDLSISFQKGPVKENGVNGISNEALLAIVIDRLRGFQFARLPDGSFDEQTKGPYACDGNKIALMCVEMALVELHRRTLFREARGVEGTSAV